MNSTVDYTPVLLAQLTDLQMRVTKQDTTITALKAEVERLTGHSLTVSNTMRTSVPLRSHDTQEQNFRPNRFNGTQQQGQGMQRPERTSGYTTANVSKQTRPTGGTGSTSSRSRPQVAPTGDKTAYPSMSLSDILKKDETVTIQVGTGKDSEGNFTNTTATATFDGTNLCVTECEMVESLVGMKSAKPGEILYKFIDELKSTGHIKKTFTIAPWKLCFVERDSIKQSLEQLRTTLG